MKPIHLLALLPFLGFLSGGFIAEHVDPLLWGLPFLMVWNLFWMVACSCCLAIIYRHDRHSQEDRP